MSCDVCKNTDTYIKNHKHVYTIKGREVKFNSKRRFCKKCDNLVYDKELDNIASKKSLQLYNEKYGIPKEKIIALRKKYDLSQELFAKIIGCAKKTLVSYEKGTAIPNDNYVIIINSLINNPDMIISLIKANKELFSNREYDKITNIITPFISNNSRLLLNDEVFTPTEYNGYTVTNRDKIVNMILLFSDKGVLKTKLLKEMFYADFIHYKNTGASITGLEYAKLNYGPVPDEFENIITECEKSNLISYDLEFKNEYEYHIIKSLVKLDESIFTKDELKTIYHIKKYFKGFKSKDIVNFSHEEKAFTETEYYKKISYDYAFDMDRIG